jgi:heme/copper-type cytochrome/quinol oxidase subunit 3
LGLATLLLGLVVHWSILIVGALLLGYGVVGFLRGSKGLRGFEGWMLKASPSETVLAGTSLRKVGMWMFLFSEIMFFTGIIGGSLSLRAHTALWPAPGEVLNVPLTALNTFILICSSMTMVEALRGAQMGDERRMRAFLLLTMLLGIVFLGIQAREYILLFFQRGFRPTTSLYGATFYLQTGFHGGHVTAGVVALAFVNLKARRGGYTRDSHEGVELMGLYWHFIDVVWIFLFTIVYLI